MNNLFISTRILCVAAALLGLGQPCAQAQAVFTKIADTNTAIPGGIGAFSGFSLPPSLSGNKVAFQGFDASYQPGIYLFSDGSLIKVADSSTVIPGGSDPLAMFTSPSLSGDKIAFQGSTSSYQSGIYLFADGSLSSVADSNTPVPGGSGNFIGFGLASLSGDNVAFLGIDSVGQQGIYLASGGSISDIADINTSVPSGIGDFALIQSSVVSGTNVAFQAYDASYQLGIYLFANGSLNMVADGRTAVPGGNGNFSGFGDASLSGENVAFRGIDSFGKQGVYLFADGLLSKVADSNSSVPGGSGNFTGFSDPSLSGSNIVLDAIDSLGNEGVYLFSQGTLQKEIAANDTLDGKTVLSASAPSLDGEHLALLVTFKDKSQGLYTVTLNKGASIGGSLTFEEIAASATPQNVTFTLHPADGSPDVMETASVSPSGSFLLSRLPAKPYTLHIKADKYLAANVSVDTTNGDVADVTATLLAGDANNDNSVDTSDFGILVNAYNSSASDPNSGYDNRADFDGDGIVDITDFAILVNNYSLTGTP